jgi:hypothetical protein
MFVRFRVCNGRLVSLGESRRVRQRGGVDLGSTIARSAVATVAAFPRHPALPFVLLLAQTANGFDCLEYDRLRPLRSHFTGGDPALGGGRHACQSRK